GPRNLRETSPPSIAQVSVDAESDGEARTKQVDTIFARLCRRDQFRCWPIAVLHALRPFAATADNAATAPPFLANKDDTQSLFAALSSPRSIPEMQQLLCNCGGTRFLSQQRARSPCRPAWT